ncbi:MAG: aminotransferase class IV [Limisphaerales bacterium]
MIIFLNGEFVPRERAVISVFDRGFLYGDGLFETIRIFNGKPFRWREHIERLEAGAAFLGIKPPCSRRRLLAFADRLIAENAMLDSVLRIALSRGVGPSGYSPRAARTPTLVMFLRPAPKFDRRHQWKLITASIHIRGADPLSRFKTANKLTQVLARAEADEVGADEALLLNADGFVAEGAGSNVFWVKRRAVYTPPVTAGTLPGVTRAVVFEICRRLKIAIAEENIRIEDLRQADEIFLSLASWGIVQAVALDGRRLRSERMTGRIQRAYGNLLSETGRSELPAR